jgi:hypothetical protein
MGESMKIRIVMAIALCSLFFQASSAFAEKGSYLDQFGKTFTKGVKNVLSSPWEIPYTIKQHDQTDDGNPRVFRDTAGFFDGIFRTVTRAGCGLWDIGWAFIPGDQEGLPLKPETFF